MKCLSLVVFILSMIISAFGSSDCTDLCADCLLTVISSTDVGCQLGCETNCNSGLTPSEDTNCALASAHFKRCSTSTKNK